MRPTPAAALLKEVPKCRSAGVPECRSPNLPLALWHFGTPALLRALLLVLAGVVPARAQLRECTSLDKVNRQLAGRLVDYTHNHGEDRRIFSTILGRPRDLYVYLPPGYDPHVAYPLVLYLHMGYVDEHEFAGSGRLVELDRMIQAGAFPPAVVACPDGTIAGENRFRDPHSLYLNGVNGRFEDHLLGEVVPFLMSHFSIRPEREAHAILGVSGGGLGGLSIAIRHRGFFGAFAGLAAPANLRYDNCDGNYREDFRPETYRWKATYDPDEVAGVSLLGLWKSRVRTYIEPVFGDGPRVVPEIVATNPADLIFSTGLQPGELAIYLNYGGLDNWNFDAQAESFAWLAAHRGICVDLDRDPCARHSLLYFRRNHRKAFAWLGQHLLGPGPTQD